MARRNITDEMKLYDECFATLYRVAFRITHNTCDAEEVAQDSFMRYFSLSRSQRKEIETPIKWLCKTTIHRAIDLLRQRKLLTIPLENIEYKLNDSEQDSSMELSITTIKKKIEKLPTIYAIVLKLHLFEGLDFEEIAGYLELKESTVRSQYRRAKLLLIK